jgi:hypothetical protein
MVFVMDGRWTVEDFTVSRIRKKRYIKNREFLEIRRIRARKRLCEKHAYQIDAVA